MNIRIQILVVVGGLFLVSNVSWSAPSPAVYTCHVSAVELGGLPQDCPENLVPGGLDVTGRPVSANKFPPYIKLNVKTEGGSSFTQKGPSAFAVGNTSSYVQGNANASFSYEIQLGVLEIYRSFVSNVNIPVFFLARGFAVANASGPGDANGKSLAQSSLIYTLPDGSPDGTGAIECAGNGIDRQICAESTFHEPSFTVAETIFLRLDETISVGGEASIQMVGGSSETGPTELSAFAGVDPNLWIDPEFTVMIDGNEMLGEPGHRWLTAQGPYNGNSAHLPLFVTSGGMFDSSESVVETGLVSGGYMSLEFMNCNEGLVKYEIDSLDISGEIPIQRIVPDNVPLCEALNEELQPKP